MTSTKTVLVLGGSYGGARAARILSETLPPDWRVVVLERNSHMNHVYVFPRFVVLPEHAPKGFVPYTNMFTPPSTSDSSANGSANGANGQANGVNGGSSKSRNIVIQGLVTSISPHSVTYLSPSPSYDGVTDAGHTIPDSERGVEEHTLPFDYLIYALGAGLPTPCDVWGEPPSLPSPARGSKSGGIEWMQRHHETIAAAASVAIIGGGALGIQFATDIKSHWPEKSVTLIHSRQTLMPIYPGLHDVVMTKMEELGVRTILGERVMEWPQDGDKVKRIKTAGGKVVEADVVLACTGQRPRVGLLKGLANVDPVSGRIRVRPSLQIEPLTQVEEIVSRVEGLSVTENGVNGANGSSHEENGEKETGLGHIFAIGDCAHTPAIQAGHTAYWMGECAAHNVVKLINAAEAKSNGDSKPNGHANGHANGDAKPNGVKTEGDAEVAAKMKGDSTDVQPVVYNGVELETYVPGAPAIKLTLGLTDYVTHFRSGEIVQASDGVPDLQARLMWPSVNADSLPDDA
ncbi:oxidoreductase [Trichosporon asahii var. asahii CBS 8904]|uniref:Oxidoreductase n=1 Tax=Trichosporon asahii var. asahii (strain CBS 8904) TaxID=1220162 RepID=K1WNV3_TRIAC|nr:oxidoreductase [Trichosporon asahii var. asahii CBS 8904]